MTSVMSRPNSSKLFLWRATWSCESRKPIAGHDRWTRPKLQSVWSAANARGRRTALFDCWSPVLATSISWLWTRQAQGGGPNS